jgi:hypothetical protein
MSSPLTPVQRGNPGQVLQNVVIDCREALTTRSRTEHAVLGVDDVLLAAIDARHQRAMLAERRLSGFVRNPDVWPRSGRTLNTHGAGARLSGVIGGATVEGARRGAAIARHRAAVRSPLLNVNRACQTCHRFPEAVTARSLRPRRECRWSSHPTGPMQE